MFKERLPWTYSLIGVCHRGYLTLTVFPNPSLWLQHDLIVSLLLLLYYVLGAVDYLSEKA